jgi:hypothetical protein
MNSMPILVGASGGLRASSMTSKFASAGSSSKLDDLSDAADRRILQMKGSVGVRPGVLIWLK